MENQTHPIEALAEKAEQYGKASIELYRLKAIDRSADLISKLIARLVVLSLFTLFFLILNIGIALWLGEVLKQNYLGFFIVAGFYAFAGTMIYTFRDRWIKTPVKNSIILQILN